MRRKATLTTLAILSFALFLSCGEDTVTDTGPEYSRGTLDDVLLALACALEHEDIAIYEDCLSSDYTYEFAAVDCERAGVPQKLPLWQRDEDVGAMDSLFRDPSARISGAIFEVDSRWADGEDSLLRCDPSIKALFQHEGVPDTTWWVYQSWLYFRFIRDQADPNLWQIAGIHEQLKAGGRVDVARGVEPITFGRIKARFRHREQCEVFPRSTPHCLLRNFELALERMQIDEYSECLHDYYLFIFISQDADDIGLPPDEPWWGKTQDVSSMSSLFASPDVRAIMCDLEIADGPWPTEDGFEYRLDPYMQFTVDAGEGETVYYSVQSSWLDVEVVPDPYEPEQWVFRKMTERIKQPLAVRSRPGSDALAEPTTYGHVKAMFR